MSKGDDVFWRQFGVIVILLTVFGFAMYFVANSIAGDAYARMYSDQDAVVARIAPVGQSRTGDPAAQTQAPEQTAAVATQTAPVATQTAPVAEQTAAVAAQTAPVAEHRGGCRGRYLGDDPAAGIAGRGLGQRRERYGLSLDRRRRRPRGG